MMLATERRMRMGFILVMLGLAVQIGASFLWSPGTFIISAVLGVPLVVVGAVTVFLGARRPPGGQDATAGKTHGGGPSGAGGPHALD